jgi:polyferredoxin
VHTVGITIFTIVVEPLWSTIVLPLFWMNSIFWDGARFLAAPENDGDIAAPPSISHRITRKSRQRERKRLPWLPSLYFFASSWMIFGGIIHVLPMAYHSQHPIHLFTEVKNQMLATYQRVESFDAMVVLSPGVSVQYQKMQTKQMW